jgi:GNAT superfamily N-acetyltransferase
MQKKPPISLQVLDAADQADVDFIRNGLHRYNDEFQTDEHRYLRVFLRDEAGALVGGLLGDTYWGWLSISIVWIDERFRGQGYGERMLAAAEDEALRRGCVHAQLDTLSFQARPFYEKLGYRVYGALDDFPVGTDYKRYYMVKDL